MPDVNFSDSKSNYSPDHDGQTPPTFKYEKEGVKTC